MFMWLLKLIYFYNQKIVVKPDSEVSQLFNLKKLFLQLWSEKKNLFFTIYVIICHQILNFCFCTTGINIFYLTTVMTCIVHYNRASLGYIFLKPMFKPITKQLGVSDQGIVQRRIFYVFSSGNYEMCVSSLVSFCIEMQDRYSFLFIHLI